MPSPDQAARWPVIELGECTFCEVCSEVCPDVFYVNAAGYIAVAEMREYPESCVDDAIRYCPGDCIAWEGSISE